MNKWIVLLMFFSGSAMAEVCDDSRELQKAVLAEAQEITTADKKGDADFDAAIMQFQKASGMNDKQAATYAAKLLEKPELAKLQEDRQRYGTRMMTLLAGSDCNALRENNRKLKDSILLQWASVLAMIKADTQVYLAKKLANAPDIKATTEAGKKVLLHANGTWSEVR